MRKINDMPKEGVAGFDWGAFEDGRNGVSLVANPKFDGVAKRLRVFSNEKYAEELLRAYMGVATDLTAKDEIVGAVMPVVDIKRFGKSSVMVDTQGGGTAVIDMTKEKDYIRYCGVEGLDGFMEMISDDGTKREFMLTNPMIQIERGGRSSLWGGHLAGLEKEFHEQLVKPTNAYYADVLSVNKGGFIVDVSGLKCFMPGSMAAPGIITDFESYVGRRIPVMIMNYVKNAGFVVSYKKYLAKILPSKVENELSVNQEVECVVTGCCDNGVFVLFKDNEGEYLYTGMIHRDEMTPVFEKVFNDRNIQKGAEMNAFIHKITVNDDRIRIVLGDTDMENEDYVAKRERLEKSRRRYADGRKFR